MASLRIILGALALICELWPTSAEVIDIGEMEFQAITDCDHLENDGSQYNSYSINGIHCCMCNKGFKFVGHCDSSGPMSTRCELCPFDEDDPNNRTYIDFEPHVQDYCEKTRIRSCPYPMIYYGGSRVEADRCACPAGMLEDKGNCKAVPDIVSPKRDKKTENKTLQSPVSTKGQFIPQTSPSPTSQETTGRRTISEVTTIALKDPTSSTVNKVTTEISKSTEPQQNPSISEPSGTTSFSKNPVGTGVQYSEWIIVMVVVILALIAAAVAWLVRIRYCKQKLRIDLMQGHDVSYSKGGESTGPNSGENNVDVELDASRNREAHREEERSLLENESEGNPMNQADEGSNVAYNSRTQAISFNTSDVNLKAQQPVKSHARQADDRDNDACTMDDETINADASLVNLKALPLREPTNDRADEDLAPRSQRPTQRCQEEPQPRYINAQDLDELINATQAEQLVYRVGRALGTLCTRNDILPVMRDLIGFDHEIKLTELGKEYEHDTAEFIFQCISYAFTVKGSDLTAKYLLESIKKSGKNLYTETVQKEIIKILNLADQGNPSIKYIWGA